MVNYKDPVFAKGEIAGNAINCKQQLEWFLAKFAEKYGHVEEINRFITGLNLDWMCTVKNILQEAAEKANEKLPDNTTSVVKILDLPKPENKNVA